MKKKIIYGLLALLLCVTLVGCGTEENKNNNNNGEQNNDNELGYKEGALTQIVDGEGNPKQTDFVIDGIILIGNRHEYEERDTTIGVIEYFAKQGYKKEGLNSSFYLGEWIEMYIDTKYSGPNSDVKILITPHRVLEELERMSLTELEELANSNGGYVIEYEAPDASNYKYVGEGYVNQDYKEGKYDILFTYKGKLAYVINITETKE